MGIILTAVGLGAAAARLRRDAADRSHSVTKSFCFFAAGAALLAVGTREIAAVRGLIRRSPSRAPRSSSAGLAIAGAPPLAVFLSEFAILKRGPGAGPVRRDGAARRLHRHRVLRRDGAREPHGVRCAAKADAPGPARRRTHRPPGACPSAAGSRWCWPRSRCSCSASMSHAAARAAGPPPRRSRDESPHESPASRNAIEPRWPGEARCRFDAAGAPAK